MATTISGPASKDQIHGVSNGYVDSAYIGLSNISYSDPALISQEVSAFNSWDGGRWECVWGPAEGDEQANLAYVAAFKAYGSNIPIVAVLVIRGTDELQRWADFVEAKEDLLVARQYRYPLAHDPAVLVAQGTLDGLSVIQALVDPSTDEPLESFLTAFFGDGANDNPLLVVTEHSLGGCLAMVVAPWAAAVVPSSIRSNVITFAAPTAGNDAFATYLQKLFPRGNRYWNSLDVVPMAWNDLDGIQASFAGGASIPGTEWSIVEAFKGLTRFVTYMQPSPASMLTGTLCGLPWEGEVFSQHNATTYANLLAGGSPHCTTQP